MILKIKLKKQDEVCVIAGKDKGKTGKILKVVPSTNKAFVSGINMITKHQKATQAGTGGLVKKESPIDISNLVLMDPKLKVPTKVGFKLDKNGTKVRFAKKSGEILLDSKE